MPPGSLRVHHPHANLGFGMLADLRGPIRLAPSLCPSGRRSARRQQFGTSEQRALYIRVFPLEPHESCAEPASVNLKPCSYWPCWS